MILLLAGAAFLLFGRHTIRLSAGEIQSELAHKFPLEKRELIFTARFSNPTVGIDSSSNRVSLQFSTTISSLGMRAVGGRTMAEGALRYDANSGDLYLVDPVVKVREFELTGLPVKYQGAASAFLEKGLFEFLKRAPIYRLKSRDSKLLALSRVLKSIRVDDGDLLIELGF